MTADLVVRDVSVVSPEGVATADVAVEGGRVLEVAPGLSGVRIASGGEEIHGGGLTLMPGLVDAHVHFNEPGRTAWEGATTGSAGLVSGGGTAFIDMPLNSIPPTLDGPSFDAKRNALEGRSHADFALYGGLTPQSLHSMEELAARGVVGFKAFMVPSGVEEFQHADDLTLLRGMENAASLGLSVLLHAESAALTGALGEEARARGETDAASFARSRPIISELEAVSRALLYAEETGCAVHFVHLSNSRAVELVRRAVAERGLDATCETCPHYLFLTDEDAARTGPTAKCAPPLRPEAERARLAEALRAGRIDTVGSDHSPSPPSLKETDTFAAAWGGISGVQTTLRTLLTIGLELPAIAAVAADAPARRFGLAAKGRISPGYDADLTLIDPGAESVLTAEELHDRHRLSPYVGRRLRGRVERVFLRGRTVFRRGAAGGGALVEPPGGRLLTPSSRNGHSLV